MRRTLFCEEIQVELKVIVLIDFSTIAPVNLFLKVCRDPV